MRQIRSRVTPLVEPVAGPPSAQASPPTSVDHAIFVGGNHLGDIPNNANRVIDNFGEIENFIGATFTYLDTWVSLPAGFYGAQAHCQWGSNAGGVRGLYLDGYTAAGASVGIYAPLVEMPANAARPQTEFASGLMTAHIEAGGGFGVNVANLSSAGGAAVFCGVALRIVRFA